MIENIQASNSLSKEDFRVYLIDALDYALSKNYKVALLIDKKDSGIAYNLSNINHLNDLKLFMSKFYP